ncbi:MAG: cysteine-rich CWC family protein [Bermanella sp.]
MNSLIIDPLLCPLCQQQNRCVNLGDKDTNKICWCNNPEIQFPKELLDQVPEDKKGKACICQQCARSFSNEKINGDAGVKKYTPE